MTNTEQAPNKHRIKKAKYRKLDDVVYALRKSNSFFSELIKKNYKN
jgi:hypothetical protein